MFIQALLPVLLLLCLFENSLSQTDYNNYFLVQIRNIGSFSHTTFKNNFDEFGSAFTKVVELPFDNGSHEFENPEYLCSHPFNKLNTNNFTSIFYFLFSNVNDTDQLSDYLILQSFATAVSYYLVEDSISEVFSDESFKFKIMKREYGNSDNIDGDLTQYLESENCETFEPTNQPTFEPTRLPTTNESAFNVVTITKYVTSTDDTDWIDETESGVVLGLGIFFLVLACFLICGIFYLHKKEQEKHENNTKNLSKSAANGDNNIKNTSNNHIKTNSLISSDGDNENTALNPIAVRATDDAMQVAVDRHNANYNDNNENDNNNNNNVPSKYAHAPEADDSDFSHTVSRDRHNTGATDDTDAKHEMYSNDGGIAPGAPRIASSVGSNENNIDDQVHVNKVEFNPKPDRGFSDATALSGASAGAAAAAVAANNNHHNANKNNNDDDDDGGASDTGSKLFPQNSSDDDSSNENEENENNDVDDDDDDDNDVVKGLATANMPHNNNNNKHFSDHHSSDTHGQSMDFDDDNKTGSNMGGGLPRYNADDDDDDEGNEDNELLQHGNAPKPGGPPPPPAHVMQGKQGYSNMDDDSKHDNNNNSSRRTSMGKAPREDANSYVTNESDDNNDDEDLYGYQPKSTADNSSRTGETSPLK